MMLRLGELLIVQTRPDTLADMAFSDPDIVDALPQDVITALDLSRDWMRGKLPDRAGFLDLSSL